jgi:hypothetical protein
MPEMALGRPVISGVASTMMSPPAYFARDLSFTMAG